MKFVYKNTSGVFKLILLLIFSSFINTPHAQQTCAAPTIIASLPYTLASGTTCGSVNNYTTTIGGSTLYVSGEDLIFRFIPATTGAITISVTQPAGAYLAMYLYTGCPFSAYVGGVQNNVANKSFTVTVTAGVTYYLMLDTWAAPTCTAFTNLTITAPPSACSGTPNAGTATISASSGCSGSNFTLTGTGLSSGAGITYQWQSGPSATGPWTNITGATAATLTTSTTANTFYRLVTTCTNSGLTNNTNAVSRSINTCTIQFNLTDAFGDGWNGATMNFIVNGSTFATIGSTFTTGTAQTLNFCVPANSTYSLVYTSGGSFASEVGIASIIVNGSSVYSVGAGGATVGATLTSGIACPAGCTGTPNAGTATISSASGCGGATFTLSASGISTGGGITYQWQSGPSATGPWTNIAGATTSTYNTSTTNNTFYRLITNCTLSGLSATSSVVSYTPTPGTCFIQFNLTDAFGDGWNGATMNFIVNGASYATIGSTFTTGTAQTLTYCIPQNSSYSLVYTNGGSYPSEVGIAAMIVSGSTVYSVGAGGAAVGATLVSGISCPLPCSGTPTPGNTIASAATTTPGGTVGLSLQSAGGTGVNYQWQSGPTSVGPWTNFGANTTNLSTVVNANTWYQCVVTCTNSGQTATSNPVQVTLSWCTPTGSTTYYLTNASTTGGATNFSNPSGASAGGYGNYSNTISCSNIIGTPTSITLNSNFGSDLFFCWIDWNNDLDFLDANEAIFASGTYAASFTGTINIPAGTPNGTYRMRVANSYIGSAVPCGPNSWGEYEDYSFIVLSNCAGLPPAATASITGATPICYGNTTTLSGSVSAIFGGISYQWGISSTPGGPYTNITGATALSYTTANSLAPGTYYFVANSNCSFSGQSSVSNEVSITVNGASSSFSMNPPSFCGVGGGSTLAANPPAAGASYAWSTNGGTLSTNSGSSTTATLTSTSEITLSATLNGCTSTTTQSIGVYSFPAITPTATPSTICGGTSSLLETGLSASNFAAICITPTPLAIPATANYLVNNGVASVALSSGSLDDGGWGAIPLGFTFNFFGSTYSSINVGTNGVLQFGAYNAPALGDFIIGALPNNVDPMGAIYGCANDLHCGYTGANVRYWTAGAAPNRKFVINYQVFQFGATTTPVNFQIILYETLGQVDIVATQIMSTNAKSIGVNSPTGTIGAAAPNCAATPNTASYWSAQTATIPAGSPQAWKFLPPINYVYNWSVNGVANPAIAQLNGTSVTTTSTSQSPANSTNYQVYIQDPITSCSQVFQTPVTVIPTPAAPTATNWTQCGPQVPQASVSCPTCTGNQTFNWYTAATNGTLFQGIINETFNTGTTTGTLYGDATLVNSRCRLTNDVASQNGALLLGSTGVNSNAYSIDFDFRVFPSDALGYNGADGFSYSFGDDVSATATVPAAENGSGSKLKVGFVSYTNGASTSGIYLMYNCPTDEQTPTTPGVIAYSSNMTWKNTNAFIACHIGIDALGQVTLTLNGTPIFTNIQLPANYLLQNKSTWQQLFKARTGAGFSRHMIDNVHVEALPSQQFNTIQQTVANTVTYYVQTLDGICGSQTLTPITVTVNPAPAVGISANFNGCQYGSYPVAVTSGQNSYSNFTWSPAGLLFLDSLHTTPYTAGSNATNLWFYAGASGVQPAVTMTALDNGVGALQCSQSVSVVATLQAAPATPVIAASNNLLCTGATTTLAVQAGGAFCASAANTIYDEEITNVSIGSLNNTSDCITAAPGAGSILSRYANYTSGAGAPASPTFNAGSTVSGTVTVGSCGAFNYTSGLAIFIDFNQDGDFADAGEKVYSNGAASNIACVPATIQSVSLTIPANALNGQTRMRIINAESYSGDIITPCLTPGYGETEDYLITIAGGVSNTYVWAPSVAGNSTAPSVTTNAIYSSTNFTATLFDGTCYSAPSNQITVGIAGNPVITATASVPVGGYCTPSMSFGCSFPDIISNVTVAGVNNSTLCNNTSGANGYSYFNNLTGTLTAGANNVPYSVTTDGDVEGAAMWIDFNQNGSFEATENIFNGIIGTAPATYAGTFNVPVNAVNGPTRMRVRCMYNNNPGAGGECSSGAFGETEDYNINITGGINNIPCPGSTFNLVSMVANGGQPFTYNWTVLSGNATLSSSTAQNPTSVVNSDAVFQVTMTDNCGAVSTTTVSANIDENPITITPGSNVICAYDSVALNAANGINYSWSPSTSLTSGTAAIVQAFPLANTSYTLTGGYGNGCIGTATATVNVNALPIVTANANQTICAGTAVTLTGGGASTYSWNNGISNGVTFVPSNTATYTVNGIDANGCHNTAQTTITVNPLPIVGAGTPQAICIGSNVTLAGSGAVSYAWNNNVVDGIAFSPNSTSSYTVTGTDANGCINTAQTTVTVNMLPVLAVAPSNVLCFGGTGSVILSATGSGPFTYGGDPTQNLLPGTYSYTATSIDGCISVPVSINISQPQAALSLSTTQINVDCFGNNSGSIDLTPVGGTSQYTYAWSNSSTQEDPTNLMAGSYNVVVTDNNGCTLSTNVTVSQPAAPLTLSTSQINVDCFGNNTGSIDLTPAGGTSQYAFAWSNNTSNEDPSALLAGTYNVMVTDAQGCTATTSLTISEPAAPLTLSTTQLNVDCFGNNTGSIDLSPAGGTPQYTYAWSNNSSLQDLNALIAGQYNVLVTDVQGCTATTSVTISEPAASLSLSTVPVDVLCYGNNTGSIDLIVAGGTGPFGFAWSNNNSTEDIVNLMAGSYNVVVTDNNGCTLSTNAVINQPLAPLTLTATQANMGCFSSAIGSIDLTPAGGTAPYNFAWSNNTAIEDPTNLAAGNYNVLVTDAHGCTNTIQQIVLEYALPNVNAGPNAAICIGNPITLTASGALTYSWNNGVSNGVSFNPNTSATYTVTGTDIHGCVNTDQVVVTVNALPVVNPGNNQTVCVGTSVMLAATGASNYTWSNGVPNGTPMVANNSGVISVIGVDINGCIDTAQFTLTVNTAPNISITGGNTVCQLGSLNLSASSPNAFGGVWSTSNGQGTFAPNLSNANITYTPSANDPASVTFTYTAFNQCGTAASNTSVGVLSSPNLNAGLDVSTCTGTNVTLTATSNATVTWSNNVTNGVAFPAQNGQTTYTATATGANGCVVIDHLVVTGLANPGINAGDDQTICAGESIILYATGGITYTWTNGVMNNVPFTPNVSGTYTVSGTGSNGCSGQDVVLVTVNAVPNAIAVAADPITLVATPAGQTYQWTNCTLNEVIAGAVSDTLVASANGSYAVIVTNASGCSDTSDCMIIDNVGLYVPNSATIALYPNPTNGIVTLEIPAQEGASAFVYDAQGKLILTVANAKNGEQFDLSKLSTGVYTFRVTLNNLTHIEKVVKH